MGSPMTKIRLLLHADSSNKSDANTFAAAAKTVEADYKKLYRGDQITTTKVGSGKDIVDAIALASDGAIRSLDIFSYGNQGGIHISRKLAVPVDSGYVKQGLHFLWRIAGDKPQGIEEAAAMEESIHGLYSDQRSLEAIAIYFNQTFDTPVKDYRFLNDINFGKFAESAVVELHGCKTAQVIKVLNFVHANFCAQLSALLPRGGVVIGHTMSANPNNANKKTDYRHGEVRVYKDGKTGEPQRRALVKIPNSSTP